jgi:hypothetical protein
LIDCDGVENQTERGIGPVVIPGAKVRALRDTNIGSYVDLSEVIDPNAFSDPGVLADGEQPWILHDDARL